MQCTLCQSPTVGGADLCPSCDGAMSRGTTLHLNVGGLRVRTTPDQAAAAAKLGTDALRDVGFAAIVAIVLGLVANFVSVALTVNGVDLVRLMFGVLAGAFTVLSAVSLPWATARETRAISTGIAALIAVVALLRAVG